MDTGSGSENMNLTKYQSRARSLSLSLFIMDLVLIVSLSGPSHALIDSTKKMCGTSIQSQSHSSGYWSTDEFSTSTPEDQGIDSDKLGEMKDLFVTLLISGLGVMTKRFSAALTTSVSAAPSEVI